ncbi:MAG: ribonuclease protein component [Verrucomicrobiales bacterium]|nr:ribonuclease protein component [Verrucomicrobiales bacterium]
MALPRAQRLCRSADFAAMRESGRSWTGRHLIVAVRARPDRKHAHFGFTTSRRVGNAVKRNLVRRRLRMIAREFACQIGLTCDVVTIARNSAVRAEYETLRQDWLRLAGKAGLFGPALKASVNRDKAPSPVADAPQGPPFLPPGTPPSPGA